MRQKAKRQALTGRLVVKKLLQPPTAPDSNMRSNKLCPTNYRLVAVFKLYAVHRGQVVAYGLLLGYARRNKMHKVFCWLEKGLSACRVSCQPHEMTAVPVTLASVRHRPAPSFLLKDVKRT